MSKVAHGRVLISQKWCRVISWPVVVVSRSSWLVFLIVVVSHGARSFFLVVVVSLLHDQSFLVEELACRHVAQDKLFFKNAALYVKSCAETFFFGQSNGKVRDTDMSLI